MSLLLLLQGAGVAAPAVTPPERTFGTHAEGSSVALRYSYALAERQAREAEEEAVILVLILSL